MKQNKILGVVMLLLAIIVMGIGIYLTAQRQQALAMEWATSLPTAGLMLQMAGELIFWVIHVAAITTFLLVYGASFYIGEFALKSRARP